MMSLPCRKQDAAHDVSHQQQGVDQSESPLQGSGLHVPEERGIVAAAAGSKEVHTALKTFMNITGSIPASDPLTHKSCFHCWILFCYA